MTIKTNKKYNIIIKSSIKNILLINKSISSSSSNSTSISISSNSRIKLNNTNNNNNVKTMFYPI